MPSRARRILALAALTGCASGPLPEHLRDPARHPRLPRRSFVTAVGTGTTRQVAEQRAKAGVSQQIASSISSELELMEREVSRNGRVESDRVLWERIRLKSSFGRAELILIDAASSAVRDGLHHAFAYLSREAADRQLAGDQADAIRELREAYCRVRSAAAGLDGGAPSPDARCPTGRPAAPVLPGLATAWSDLRAHYAGQQALAAQRRALRLSGGAPPGPGRWYDDALALAGEARRRARWVVSIDAGDAPDELRTRVAEVAGGAMQALGLSAAIHPAGDPCRAGAPGTFPFGLAVRVELDTRLGPLGWETSLRLPARGRGCGSDRAGFEVDLAGAGEPGSDPARRDRSVAQAVGALDIAAASKALRKPISGLCPLP